MRIIFQPLHAAQSCQKPTKPVTLSFPHIYSYIIYCCSFLLLTITLVGCGGSNSGNDTTANNALSTNAANSAASTSAPPAARVQGRVGGLWVGKYQSSLSDFEVNVSGVITELGEIFFVYPENGTTQQVTEGTLSLDGRLIQNVGLGVSGQITSQAIQGFRYFNGETTVNTQLDGTLIEGQQLTLKESYQDSPSGVFTLRHDNAYNNNSSIATIAGNYSSTNLQGVTTNHNIANTGNLTGGNSLNCTHNGKVSLIDSFFNLYRITMTISNCNSLNGRWRGYATLSGGNNLNSQITFFTRSANAIQSYTLERN